MPCYNPMQAKVSVLPSGKKSVKFVASYDRLFRKGLSMSHLTDVIQLPCGQCSGCRLERSRSWAVRCMHEASLYDKNCFITLTYDPEHLPKDGSLNKRHFQLFMKRLRAEYGEGIRFYHCGEYGPKFSRPHYHACLFNFDFPDKVFWQKRGDNDFFVSDSLTKLWGLGYCSVSGMTFDTAAYCARYCMKKVTGKSSSEHYQGRCPEYSTMSRRPGIGRAWYEKYKRDVFPSDEVIVRGKSCSPPRYYTNVYEMESPDDFAIVKEIRRENQLDMIDDSTFLRLKDREKCKLSKISELQRSFEQGDIL